MNKAAKIIAIITVILLFSACGQKSSVTAENCNLNKFTNERNGLKTNLLIKAEAPQEYTEDPIPENAIEIKYKSGNMELKAWISKISDDGKKHSAIVYAHGGFAFGRSDWDDAKMYIDNGFVVMTPMVRAENGNPGNFEYFYGEVDDIIAAGNYLKSQTYVDSDKIFLAGHSVGGTLSMLTSMLQSPYKAIASFGGSPEQEDYFTYRKERIPFDYSNEKEIKLRSPIDNIESMQKPLYIYVGKSDYEYLWHSNKIVKASKKLGKKCELIKMDGDHFTSLPLSIKDSIEKFKIYTEKEKELSAKK